MRGVRRRHSRVKGQIRGRIPVSRCPWKAFYFDDSFNVKSLLKSVFFIDNDPVWCIVQMKRTFVRCRWSQPWKTNDGSSPRPSDGDRLESGPGEEMRGKAEGLLAFLSSRFSRRGGCLASLPSTSSSSSSLREGWVKPVGYLRGQSPPSLGLPPSSFEG